MVKQPPPPPVVLPPQPSQALRLEGACDFYEDLNGEYVMRGMTVSGTPYYQKVMGKYYIYHDPDCNGGGSSKRPRWIIDSDAPNASRSVDLDGDGACRYVARSTSSARIPPSSSTWAMYCGGHWEDVTLSLSEVELSNTTTATTTLRGADAVVDASSRQLPSLLIIAAVTALIGSS